MGTDETLLSLAEIAITLAGFSAVVVVFRRGSDGSWLTAHRDQFHGMVIHAICAVIFCLLPRMIDIVVQDPVTTLHICCAILGVQILVHCVAVMRFPTLELWGKLALSLGLVLGLGQFVVFTDWGAHREMDFYVLGIIWHILQAGLLFVLLVWISPDKEKL